jgi:subtilisin family serine protease
MRRSPQSRWGYPPEVETENLTEEGDLGGHGTHIAGLIGGQDLDQGFQGVALQCQLLNHKTVVRGCCAGREGRR